MEVHLKEYSGTVKEPYFFENDDDAFYISLETLDVVRTKINNEMDNFCEKEKAQVEVLLTMEGLKVRLADGSISVLEYRAELKTIMRNFFTECGFDVFHETAAFHSFYKLINEYYH